MSLYAKINKAVGKWETESIKNREHKRGGNCKCKACQKVMLAILEGSEEEAREIMQKIRERQ